MSKRVYLMTISWIGALVGLTFLTLALTANMPGHMVMANSSVSIFITESGFDPSIVTVTAGTTVVWTNQAQEAVRLASGEPYRVYLPLVLRGIADDKAAATALPIAGAVVIRQQDDWGNVDIAPGESYSHTFTTVGNYPYFLANRPDQTGLVVVRPMPLDFALGVQPLAREAMQGESVTYTVAVTALHSFEAPITLSVGGAPTGALVSWATNLLPSTTSGTLVLTPTADAILAVTPALSSPTGTFTLVITGTGGGWVHTATAILAVVPRPDFVLGVQPLAREVAQGESTTYTVVVTALNGFAEPVTLDVGGTLTDTVVSWSANPLVPTADATLTITPSLSSPTGTFTLVITGTGGGVVHSIPVTLTITLRPCAQVGSWDGDASFTVPSDQSRVLNFELTIDSYCGTFVVTAAELPINDCRISFLVSNGVSIWGSGTFVSQTEVEGSFTVYTPSCLGWGNWDSSWVSNR